MGYLLKVLDLLGRDFLVQNMLLLLVPDLILKVSVASTMRVLIEERCHVAVLTHAIRWDAWAAESDTSAEA